MPPPSYKVLRFDEDYSCLTNPANRSDWFDPVKYIPLSTNHPNLYLSLGGELRERFEAMHNPDFGIPGSHDSYWLQRNTLLTDLHLGERVRVFAEGISGLDEGNTLPAPPVQRAGWRWGRELRFNNHQLSFLGLMSADTSTSQPIHVAITRRIKPGREAGFQKSVSVDRASLRRLLQSRREAIVDCRR